MAGTPITSLLTAIQSLFTTSGINAQFPGGMWADIAPENSTMPYVLTKLIACTPTLFFPNSPSSESTTYGEAQVQFSVVGIGRSAMMGLMSTYVQPTYDTRIDLSGSGSGTTSNFIRMHDPIPLRLGRDESITDSPVQGDAYQVTITEKYVISP